MRRWFLSYHSPDHALAEGLKRAIERKQADTRVFFAPEHLRSGFWSRALADEIAQADVFVLLIGEKGVGPWQVLEYDAALDRKVTSPGFELAVVLLEGQMAPGLQFLRQLHWIVTSDPTSEKDVARLIDAAAGGGTRSGALWRHTAPYRGLPAMEETDSDYFFGRGRETVEALRALASRGDRLPVLLGNSGVGKSSVARAGVMAALKRQAWPAEAASPGDWPRAFAESRRWCYLTLKPGADPLRVLVGAFLDVWQFAATDPERVKRLHDWSDLLLQDRTSLRDLIEATDRRFEESGRERPPAYFLYVDQGEELYVHAEDRARRRFSELLAGGLSDPRLLALMSLRADFLGELQKDERLHDVHLKVDVPPLREAALRAVVRKPAELLSARIDDDLVEVITRRTAEDSARDAGALPLLSYTLDDMWKQMVAREDGVLRLVAASFEPGGVLVDRADGFLAAHPESEETLRRLLTLKLATVREGEGPTRRRALRSEFTVDEWRLISSLADHPNRLLVVATPEGGETYAEVAHEAIFRRWQKLREWIAAERGFLAWRTGLEAARRHWQSTLEAMRPEALLMGVALTQAQRWFASRRDDLSDPDRDFVLQSLAREARRRGRARRGQALVYALLIGIIVALAGAVFKADIEEVYWWHWVMARYASAHVTPHVLTAEAERALRPGSSFRECDKDCPEMVVVPAGRFTMGSPADERGRFSSEGPQREVTLPQAFAVSRFEITFEDWETCVAVHGCPSDGRANDAGFGRGKRPVIYVSWDDAKAYVAWLSFVTGRQYRLLTEAEWEYAARAGTSEAYSWGENFKKDGEAMANCDGCGSQFDKRSTGPVGSFPPNAFGLHDMLGNAWEWVEDCYDAGLEHMPSDGSARSSEVCNQRVGRGGSWYYPPRYLRSASRSGLTPIGRTDNLGFRVGRTLHR